MEQWLIEGKFTEKEALMISCDMLAAGIDTVSLTNFHDCPYMYVRSYFMWFKSTTLKMWWWGTELYIVHV